MDSALIGVFGVVLGILLSNGAARILESIRRRERIQDIRTALRAEIRSHRQRLLLFADPTEDIAAKITDSSEAGAVFTPYRDYLGIGMHALRLADEAIAAIEGDSVAWTRAGRPRDRAGRGSGDGFQSAGMKASPLAQYSAFGVGVPN